MLQIQQILSQIENNLDAVIKGEAGVGRDLWHLLLAQHPADIASLLKSLTEIDRIELFKKFPLDLSIDIFERLPEEIQAEIIVHLDLDHVADLLKEIRPDHLINLFEHMPDDLFKKYSKLLQKKQRSKLISMLNFPPESAGRIMNTEVLAFPVHFTIKSSIRLLQRLQPQREHLLRRIYTTDSENRLLGYINLDELVLNNPEMPLEKIMHKNELIINVNDDRELVANQLDHYDLLSAPVVDSQGHFLGIITAEEAVEIAKQEAKEDIYKISGLPTTETGYFQTSFWESIRQRSPWLVSLLILQSVSGFILQSYKLMLKQHAIIAFFITMLIGTAGNAGGQSGALIIRGLATGEMNGKNGFKILLREFGISLTIATLLSVIGFVRVLITHEDLLSAFIIALSLFLIVIASMMLGTIAPLLLHKMNFDPAHSAAPFLATMTDIIGILIYCMVASKLFEY